MGINGKSLLKDKKGNANVIILAIFTIVLGFGMLTIGTYLYYQIATSADAGQVIASRGAQATGLVVFNGTNITSDASIGSPTNVTFTDGGTFIFEFNTSATTAPTCKVANCILVNLSNTNTSLGAATNLTARINANATLSAVLTAARSSNNTTITYNTRTTTGNGITLTTLAPAGQSVITVSGLSGGLNDVNGQAAQNSINNYVNITFPLMGLAMMLLGFGVIIYTLRTNLGTGEKR